MFRVEPLVPVCTSGELYVDINVVLVVVVVSRSLCNVISVIILSHLEDFSLFVTGGNARAFTLSMCSLFFLQFFLHFLLFPLFRSLE